MEQQQLSDYVKSKRALFLLRFSLDVKKEEMQKLEQQASDEERRLQVRTLQMAFRIYRHLRQNSHTTSFCKQIDSFSSPHPLSLTSPLSLSSGAA